MSLGAKRKIRGFNIWPGYVDVLSSLLMVLIFVLMIFTIAQFLLTQTLAGQDSELTSLHKQVAELTKLLGLEQGKNAQLDASITELTVMVGDLTETRETLTSQVEALTRHAKIDRDELKKQLLTMASLQEDISALRQVRAQLEEKVGQLAAALESGQKQAGALRDRSKALEAQLAKEGERSLLAQKTIESKEIRIQALTALVGNQQQALKQEQTLSASARAEVVLLNQQLAAMKRQLEEIGRALDVAEKQMPTGTSKIKDLGKRLNIVLARRVNKLEKYRSEFFGRLREALGNNPSVQVQGDRFVFQAELLFASGSADLGQDGKQQLMQLATILKAVAKEIPKDLNWILRIDGHTDRVPINNLKFASNWELSTARAVSVVRFLAKQGIPEDRMAATGFSKFHPLDPADTVEAYRRNRRIEIKLTSP
jgi:chemotaxis protein MotB